MFPLETEAAKIAYSEIAGTKTKFLAPFWDNTITIAENFPSKIGTFCFLLRFYVPLRRKNNLVNWILTQKTIKQVKSLAVRPEICVLQLGRSLSIAEILTVSVVVSYCASHLVSPPA